MSVACSRTSAWLLHNWLGPWGVNVDGVNGDISFIKEGPKGKESAQNVPNVYVVTIKDGKIALP